MEDSTLVTFEVTAPVALGETVCICGDHAELGGFNRASAKELVTDPNSYPVWRLNVILPRGMPRKYKYMTTGFRQWREWEPINVGMRTITPEGETMVVRDEYGKLTRPNIIKAPPVPNPSSAATSASTSPSDAGRSALASNDFGLPPIAPPTSSHTGLTLETSLDLPPLPSPSPKPYATRATTPTLQASTPRTKGDLKEAGSLRLKKKKASGTKRLLLVAFHLPVKLRYVGDGDEDGEEWIAEWDADNVAAKTEDSVADEMQVTWIGAVTHSNVFGIEWTLGPSAKRIAGIQRCLKPMNCVPVFLDAQVYLLHYAQFSKNVLWDIFHNVLRPRTMASEVAYENGFVPGNIAFAEAAFPLLQRGDFVWVHDYHLMLVPKKLRDLGHEGPIIFFLHMPFPTSEIFRTLPMRHELLEGMLSSSTIGFHTFNHGRHFLTACRRFLGAHSRSLAQGTLAVEHRDRRVLITISHLGVDPQRLSISRLPETIDASKKILAEMPNPPNFRQPSVVFGSLDDMLRLKGVPLKLLAFERFLNQSKWKGGEARFILWTIKQSGPRRHDTERSTAEVRRLVQRINDQHGPVVVHREFDTQNPPSLAERVALWLAVDVYVSTAVSEGLNLFPLEYMYCRNEESPGTVIVSEFSASSSVLNGALRVNCYDIGYIAMAMEETARMPLEEKKARRARDVDYITARASQWTRHVITEVLTALEDDSLSTTIAHVPLITGSGVSLSHAVQCKPLRSKDVVRAFNQSSRRAFFLDFGGTLVEREEENLTLKKDFLGAMGRGLSAQMKATLQRLCEDEERNIVFIVSGDTRTVLTRVFFDLLVNNVPLGLVAHSGLCIRLPMKDSNLAKSKGEYDDEDYGGDHSSHQGFNPKMNIMTEKQHLEKLQLQQSESDLLSNSESSIIGAAHDAVLVRSLSEVPVFRPHQVTASLAAQHQHQHQHQHHHQLQEQHQQEEQQPQNQLISDWLMTVDISKEWSNWMREAGIIPILKNYTWATVGTFYRTSGITTLWDYTFADPEWGLSQANFLILELEAAIANANLNIVVKRNKSVVQLLPKSVDKGSAVRRVLSMQNEVRPNWKGQAPDFILSLGDDTSDELMFKALHQYYGNLHSGGSSRQKSNLFTATVGRKPTSASYYLRDTDAVQTLLSEIVDSTVA